jgi:hypothetical protein
MTDSAIETFLDEVRQVGNANGLLKEEHVEIIRTALVNGYDAAGDDPRLLDLWDGVRDVISDRKLSVKARLIEMGKAAERFDEQQRGKAH